MKFTYFKTSEYFANDRETVEINTLDELIIFLEKTKGKELIIQRDLKEINKYALEIYDTWRE